MPLKFSKKILFITNIPLFKPYICTMNNISFKANLVIDKKLYTKLPEGTPEGYTENLVGKYKSFVEQDVIKKITEGDTIELYKAPYKQGFAVGLRFTSDKFEKPIEGGVFTNKKIPEVRPESLIYQTMQFIIAKADMKLLCSSRIKETFVKATQKLLDEKKE